MYGHIFSVSKMAIMYVKRTQLRGMLIVTLVILYNGVKLADLLRVSVNLIEDNPMC